MPTLVDLKVKYLFPTPVIYCSIPNEEAGQLNAALEKAVFAKAQAEHSAELSNIGGWQSSADLQDWGGAPVDVLIKAIKYLISQVTYFRSEPKKDFEIDWKVYAWANINSGGDYNVVHTHPGAYWSAVYYVKIPKEADNIKEGGNLEFSDPRGSLPIIYAPQFGWRLRDCENAGGREVFSPKSGDCVLFPAWLPHSVTPHRKNEARISLAFNFCLL
jgi:uncharacterized protein (TIGR02466 family)